MVLAVRYSCLYTNDSSAVTVVCDSYVLLLNTVVNTCSLWNLSHYCWVGADTKLAVVMAYGCHIVLLYMAIIDGCSIFTAYAVVWFCYLNCWACLLSAVQCFLVDIYICHPRYTHHCCVDCSSILYVTHANAIRMSVTTYKLIQSLSFCKLSPTENQYFVMQSTTPCPNKKPPNLFIIALSERYLCENGHMIS